MAKLRAAIIGMGFMGKLFARILKQIPETSLVAICDLAEEPLSQFASEIGTSPAIFPGGDAKGLLEKHPEIDAVLICTPEDSHAEAACLAAGMGKHLFIEKPLATTVDDGKAIARAVRKSGVKCMPGFTLRFDPRYAGAKDAVARGEIGDVVHMYARRNSPLAILKRIGGRQSGTNWVGSHDLDFMLWVKSCSVESVFARHGGQRSADFPVEQAITSSLRFSDGTIGVLENVWGTVPYPGRHDRIELQINGTRGTIEVHPAETGLGIFREGGVIYPDTVYMPVIQGKIAGVYRDELEYFVETIRSGGQPIITVEDGLAAVLVADAIERSRAEGREIPLEY